MSLIILLIVIVLLLGALPVYPYSREWGYYPSAGITTVLLIILLLWLFGMLPT